MIQPWILAFNPPSHVGLTLPTWITLKQLPLEYLLSAEPIARGSGEILGVDQVNVTAKFPTFYIALDVEQGWVGAISLPSLEVKVLVDCDSALIRCRYCLDTTHCVKDCHELLHKRKP